MMLLVLLLRYRLTFRGSAGRGCVMCVVLRIALLMMFLGGLEVVRRVGYDGLVGRWIYL